MFHKRSILSGAFATVFLLLVTGCTSQSALAATQVTPVGAGSIDISGTVTLGGTYQTAAAANAGRQNCTIQNPSSATESLKVKIGAMAQPYELAAGQAVSTLNGTVTATDAITVTAATTSHAFAGSCQNSN